MTLIDYWKNLGPREKKAFAESLDTSPAYLSQIANGHRNASPAFAIAIDLATGGEVPREQIRPDIFSVEAVQGRPAVANG